jgi:hypothetical protein
MSCIPSIGTLGFPTDLHPRDKVPADFDLPTGPVTRRVGLPPRTLALLRHECNVCGALNQQGTCHYCKAGT